MDCTAYLWLAATAATITMTSRQAIRVCKRRMKLVTRPDQYSHLRRLQRPRGFFIHRLTVSWMIPKWPLTSETRLASSGLKSSGGCEWWLRTRWTVQAKRVAVWPILLARCLNWTGGASLSDSTRFKIALATSSPPEMTSEMEQRLRNGELSILMVAARACTQTAARTYTHKSDPQVKSWTNRSAVYAVALITWASNAINRGKESRRWMIRNKQNDSDSYWRKWSAKTMRFAMRCSQVRGWVARQRHKTGWRSVLLVCTLYNAGEADIREAGDEIPLHVQHYLFVPPNFFFPSTLDLFPCSPFGARLGVDLQLLSRQHQWCHWATLTAALGGCVDYGRPAFFSQQVACFIRGLVAFASNRQAPKWI